MSVLADHSPTVQHSISNSQDGKTLGMVLYIPVKTSRVCGPALFSMEITVRVQGAFLLVEENFKAQLDWQRHKFVDFMMIVYDDDLVVAESD